MSGNKSPLSNISDGTVLLSVWEEQSRLNIPSALWLPLRSHFMCNVDEASVLGSEGTVKVLGDAEQKKHQKNLEDNHDSITIVRVGNAAGADGPLIFLVKGKAMDVSALKVWEKCGAPIGSTIIMTPSA